MPGAMLSGLIDYQFESTEQFYELVLLLSSPFHREGIKLREKKQLAQVTQLMME